jgi:RNA-directed DNA polymerase
VKSCYASIDHDVLLKELMQHLDNPKVLGLLWQDVRRTVYADGNYEDVTSGISQGCLLSPVIAAIFLDRLDNGRPFRSSAFAIVLRLH